jgi:drug/metabolite transporter (DMT)-like permease
LALMATPATHPLRTIAFTGLALVAFAANSVLCRLALGGARIDAASFATIRLCSGAVMLLALSTLNRKPVLSPSGGNWISAFLLFVYAIAFSFAYLSLSAGTGALILFGAVQATMILVALGSGERPRRIEWVGLLLAITGLVYLVFPGITAPSPVGAALMTLAGISWGFYSLRGRGILNPLAATSGNFLRAVPFAAVASLMLFDRARFSEGGVTLSIVSGAVTSGVGYVIWYAALRGLTATRAATVQLAVPVLAAIGGVTFMAERVSARLLLSALMVLGGVGLAVIGHQTALQAPTSRREAGT